jgi:hypothetical protein
MEVLTRMMLRRKYHKSYIKKAEQWHRIGPLLEGVLTLLRVLIEGPCLPIIQVVADHIKQISKMRLIMFREIDLMDKSFYKIKEIVLDFYLILLTSNITVTPEHPHRALEHESIIRHEACQTTIGSLGRLIFSGFQKLYTHEHIRINRPARKKAALALKMKKDRPIGLTDETLRKFRLIFAFADLNSSGRVSLSKIKEIMRLLEINVLDVEFYKWSMDFDQDQGKSLDFDDFIEIMVKISQLPCFVDYREEVF